MVINFTVKFFALKGYIFVFNSTICLRLMCLDFAILTYSDHELNIISIHFAIIVNIYKVREPLLEEAEKC